MSKSPNSAYRLAKDFVNLLRASDSNLKARVQVWAGEDAIRARLELQKRLADEAREQFTNEHAELIDAVVQHYAPMFLPGFDCVYEDSEDGDRISETEKRDLSEIGIDLSLKDPFPDVMFFDRKNRRLWCVEAVTSDGEVD